MTSRPAFRTLRLTNRGTGLLLAGATLVLSGFVSSLVPVLLLGLLLCLPVGLTALALALLTPSGRFAVSRTLRPTPAHVGENIAVSTLVAPHHLSPWSSDLLHGLGLAESVPASLRSGAALRARVRARYDDVHLEYTLTPAHRGRWPLGPLTATRVGPLGLCRATSTLGDPSSVAVRPRLLPMSGSTALAHAGISPMKAGANEPSDEDASLRRYVPGDDLRRVHWKSAARHRELLVRVDEGASLTPATIVVDLPSARRAAHDPLLERIISVGATLAIHLVETGHAVRLIPVGDAGPGSFTTGTRVVSTDEAARARILDPTIDLAPLPAGDERTTARAERLTDVVAGRRGAEQLVVVLGGDAQSLDIELAAYGDESSPSATRIAVVVCRTTTDTLVADALRNHGWRTVMLADDNLDDAWRELTGVRA
ncbi:DUF58 domain-containing protein [Sanguibacter sp. A247]|uniref:DUF58 domain-containing protein n=1 Tax=unclassified Sanguibacter TaxID=2645534 RepID=UPI003FD7B566